VKRALSAKMAAMRKWLLDSLRAWFLPHRASGIGPQTSVAPDQPACKRAKTGKNLSLSSARGIISLRRTRGTAGFLVWVEIAFGVEAIGTDAVLLT
jgi:hypothetical protein